MTKDTKNKFPQIRVRGFDGDWENGKLKELVDVFDGTHQTPNYTKSGVMFLSVENIGSLKSNKFISRKDFEDEFKNSPQCGDVLMTRIGDVGTANVVESTESIAYYVSLALLKPKALDPYFLKESISSPKTAKDIWYRTLHIAFPKKININEIEKVEINFPASKEQQKIGSFFKALKSMIEQHQHKHDKLVTLKQAMLQKMFPQDGASIPEIRFKDFRESWQEKKLENVVDVHSGRDYKHLSSGNIPVYGTGGYMLSVDKALSYDRDAIGIGRKGTIDKPYILKCPFWTVDTLFYAVSRTDYNLDFIFSIFQKINWKKMDESTGVPSLSKTAINGVIISVPHEKEQKKIGIFFSKLDELITNHAIQLEKLKQLKSAFLAKMFV